MVEEKRTRSSVRPQRRRRVTRNSQDADALPDVPPDAGPPDVVESVVIVSPASFPDPPAEQRGRARSQEDQFGANVGDEIVFPEDNSSGTPAASSPPPATTEGGVDSRRGGYLNQRGGYSDQESPGVSDRGDGVDESARPAAARGSRRDSQPGLASARAFRRLELLGDGRRSPA